MAESDVDTIFERALRRRMPEPQERAEQRTSLLAALVQIAAAAALLAAGVGWIYVRGAREEEVAHHLERARLLARPDNPADLAAAVSELSHVFALDPRNAQAHALAADLEAERAVDLGIQEARGSADAHLRMAVQLGSHSEHRYAAELLLAVADGHAAEVPARVDALMRQGARSPRFWEALGRAHLALGEPDRALDEFGRALMDGGPSPRLLTVVGEAQVADKRFPQAIDTFERVLTDYPQHLRARADLTLTRLYAGERLTEAWKDQIALSQREKECAGVLAARVQGARAELKLVEQRPFDAWPLALDAGQRGNGDLFTEITAARVAAEASSEYLSRAESPLWSRSLLLAESRARADARSGRWEAMAARVVEFDAVGTPRAHERAELLRQVGINELLAARTRPASADAVGRIHSAVFRARAAPAPASGSEALLASAREELSKSAPIGIELYREALRAAAMDQPPTGRTRIAEQVVADLNAAGQSAAVDAVLRD